MIKEEQVKCAAETISLFQDYMSLAKVEKQLKSDVVKEGISSIIGKICEKALENVSEVL